MLRSIYSHFFEWIRVLQQSHDVPMSLEFRFWFFYLIWAWLPSYSCDPNPKIKVSTPPFPDLTVGDSMRNMTSIGTVASKKVWISWRATESLWACTKIIEWRWPSATQYFYQVYYVTTDTKCCTLHVYSFWEIHCYSIFLCKSICGKDGLAKI